MKEIVLDLMCDLTEAEVNDRAQQLSGNLSRYDEVELEKASRAKHYTELLKQLGGSTRKLSRIIRDRAETRPVICGIVFHSPAQGTKRIVRMDTGEIVRDEPMSAMEHQNNLFEEPRQEELMAGEEGTPEPIAENVSAEDAIERAAESVAAFIESETGGAAEFTRLGVKSAAKKVAAKKS